MIVCEDDNKAQHRHDQEAYQSWVKEDCCVCFTMLSNMHNDLIGKFEVHATTHAMWNALKLKFGGTFVTILRGLNIKLYSYKMCPNHTMKQHLRTMSTMIRELKAAGNTLTEEQKIQARLCSLPDSWETMLISLTQSENIKTFYDVSRHLDLEVERLEASKTTKAAKYGSTYMANNDSRAPRGPKCKNYAQRQDSDNGIVPKKEKNTKRKRNKRNGKGKNGKCFNCDKEGHFARDCTEPRKVLPDFNSCQSFVSTYVMVVHSHPYWIIDSGAIEHVARDLVEFVEYR